MNILDIKLDIDTTQILIFGLPPYFVCAMIGFVVSISMLFILLLIKKIYVKIYLPSIIVSAIGIIVGSKIVGVLVNILDCVFWKSNFSSKTFINSGIVYYGGLFGFLLFFSISTNKFKDVYNKIVLNSIAVVIPLFHSIGRLGCFLGGCCYGKEYNGFLSVKYTNIIDKVTCTAERIPTQLIESSFELLLFFILLVLFVNNKNSLLKLYLLFYSIFRFCVEFLRGDIIRGVYYLSTSQWISIIVLAVLFYNFASERKALLNEESI